MWIIQSLFDLMFPPACAVCKKSSYSICDSCLRLFARCVDTPYPWIYSYYSYRDTHVSRLLHEYKYYHKRLLGEKLASHMIDYDLEKFLGDQEDILLVPIPMYVTRRWKRGGNHAEMLTKTFSQELHIPYTNVLLIRKKNTKQQARARTKSEREQSIRGAFKVNTVSLDEKAMLDKKIILIDDITTTGATLLEAKKTLERAGFRNIEAITLAH